MLGTLTHNGIRTESAAATFVLDTSIVGQADVGKPVSFKATEDFTVQLNVVDAEIVGHLESFEDRSQSEGTILGAVSWHGCHVYAYTGTAPTRGGHVVCDASGGVKAAGATAGLQTLVTAVDTTASTCEVLLR